MRIFISFFLVLIIFSTVTAAIGDVTKGTDGFRSLKWGANISKMKDFKKVGTDKSYGGVDIYKNKKDSMQIGSAKIKSITYGSWHGKFCDVFVNTYGYVDFQALKDASQVKYGSPIQTNQYIGFYIWEDQTAEMSLKYDSVTEVGTLHIGSMSIREEMKEYDAAKAQEGAKKDF